MNRDDLESAKDWLADLAQQADTGNEPSEDEVEPLTAATRTQHPRRMPVVERRCVADIGFGCERYIRIVGEGYSTPPVAPSTTQFNDAP